MKKFLIFILLLLMACSPKLNNDFYLVYSNYHLFKVFTPKNWENDIQLAHKYGLSTLFHPPIPVFVTSDMIKPTSIMIYANGWDKVNANATLKNMIEAETEKFKSYGKSIVIKKNIIPIQFTNKNILGFESLSFYNIPNRYRDDCVYIETAKTVILISYSAVNTNLYNIYKPLFITFLSNFTFLSSNPDEIKNLLAKDTKERGAVNYKIPKSQ